MQGGIKKMKIIKGYKAFKRDADGKLFTHPNNMERNYFEVGNTYSISNNDNIELCKNGFHFCKKLNQIFDFYLFSPSIAYCEVRGIFKNDLRDIDEDDQKLCTRSITIIKELTFDEVEKILELELNRKGEAVSGTKHFQNSEAIFCSEYIRNSNAVKRACFVESSSAVMQSISINDSSVIYESDNVYSCEAVCSSMSIINSRIITSSFLIDCSATIYNSNFIMYSEIISCSNEVIKSSVVRYSEYIKKSENISLSIYIIYSFLINNSYYIVDCHNLENCLFCYRLHNKENHIFNKKVSKERFEEVNKRLQCILSNNKWYLKFTNFRKLRDRYEREKGIATLYDFVIYEDEEHFEKFPEEAIKYLKSLPEFNAKIFKAITHIDVENK